ncbi:MAG: DUF4760 domain-containing protein [Alphaproteobacteria bacterium]
MQSLLMKKQWFKILRILIFILITFIILITKKQWFKILRILIFILIIFIILIKFEWLIVMYEWFLSNHQFAVHAGILLLSAIGALLLVLDSKKNTIMNQTLQIARDEYSSQVFIQNYDVVMKLIDENENIKKISKLSKSNPKRNSLIYILNYYETIATSIKNGFLNEDFLFQLNGRIMKKVYNYSRDYIKQEQTKDKIVYSDFEWLIETKWKNRWIKECISKKWDSFVKRC